MSVPDLIVIGGTGSIGTAICEYTLNNTPLQFDIVDRDDTMMWRLWEKLGRPEKRVDTVIRDINSAAFPPSSQKINLAALKHVPVCEEHPIETVRTNIIGAAKTADQNTTYVSTDKAVNPISVYGMSKAIGEKAVLDVDGKVARLGNVKDSRGSFWHVVERQARNLGKVLLTDERMKRWFIRPEDAARFLLTVAMKRSESGVYMPDKSLMEEKRIQPILEEIAEDHGVEVEVTGKRPGEKLSEDLSWEHEEVHWISEEELI